MIADPLSDLIAKFALWWRRNFVALSPTALVLLVQAVGRRVQRCCRAVDGVEQK